MASVSIPDELYERIGERIDEDEFDSVDEYVTFSLQEILEQFENSEAKTAGDREEVIDKLRDLGYLE